MRLVNFPNMSSIEPVYFDLKQALAQHRRKGLPVLNGQLFLVPFVSAASDDPDEAERLFSHPCPDRILDFKDPTERDFKYLMTMMDESDLYRINLTFLMDRLLGMRRGSAALEHALDRAFRPYVLPSPAQDESPSPYKFAGRLQFPFLDQCRGQDLLHAYISIVGESDGFDEDVLQAIDFAQVIEASPGLFLKAFNGYRIGGRGAVNGPMVLEHCVRTSHDTDKKLETYAEKGRMAAQLMIFSSARDVIEAWFYADQFQAKRCEMIDTALRILPAGKTARWIKIDVFTILEREAMKQVFAEMLIKEWGIDALPANTEHMRMAIEDNAQGGVDRHLQYLLAQTLTPDQAYSGIAQAFCADATRRMHEFEAILNAK